MERKVVKRTLKYYCWWNKKMGFVRHCVAVHCTLFAWGDTTLVSAPAQQLDGIGGLRLGGDLLPAMAQSSAWHSIVTMQKVFGLVGAPKARPIVGKTNYRVLVQQTNPTHHGLSQCNNRTIACDSHSDTHSSKESTLKTTIYASSCRSYLKSKMYQLPPNKTSVLDIFPLSIAH